MEYCGVELLWNGMGYCGMELLWNRMELLWNRMELLWNGMVTEREKITSIYQMRLCLTVHLLSV